MSTYRRIPHAAHYGAAGQGHDLEEWDCVQFAFESPRPAEVPASATRYNGYLDQEGRLHVLYIRHAPLSAGTCEGCAHYAVSP